MSKRHPPYNRRKHPPPLRLTERDRCILETLHAFDGMMSLKQIDRLFFSGKGGTWPRYRMRLLFDNAYVTMPNAANIHRIPLAETIYFLDVKGAEVVAALYGENAREFSWRKNPRYSLIPHDLAANDFRIDIMEACIASPELTLRYWIPESEFRMNPDKITYKTTDGRTKKRYLQPDGFFIIRRSPLHQPDLIEDYAFLLEIDMATEDNPRFAREKVRPGVAYLDSQSYKQRFGIDYGRWLVVTTGDLRLANMKAQTKRVGGTGLFYFTTFERISAKEVLTHQSWQVAGSDELISIIPQT